MKRVYANGRTIVHRGDGLVDVAGPPDVCKTPSPGGPVPVPYVNAARSADLAQGARRTAIGGDPIALASSCIATSTGDEPGTAGGGVISSRIRGKLRWQSTSLDVRVEGRGVARFSDAVGHNGNTYNTAFIQQGGTGWAYGDDATALCPICDRGPDSHRVLETGQTYAHIVKLYKALQDAHQDWAKQQASNDARKRQLEAEVNDLQKALAAIDGATQTQTPATPAEVAEAKAEQKRLAKERKELQKQIKAKSSDIRRLDDQLGQMVVFKKTTPHGGYMLGVMVCKTGEVFAAMSGRTSLPGFKAVVKKLGWKLCETSSRPDDFAAANPTVDQRDRRTALTTTWSDTAAKNAARQDRYNAPGECAAAKLVAARGHVALSMSEMFFAPKQPHQVSLRYQSYDVLYYLRAALKWFTLGRVDLVRPPEREDDFDAGTTVPSCDTCQTILPMALCDVAERTCSASAPPAPAASAPPAPSSSTGGQAPGGSGGA